MAYIDVANKGEAVEQTPPAGYASWLDFWEKRKRKKAGNCEVSGCGGPAEVGGHVIKAGKGKKEFILPLCKNCNNKPEGEIFQAWESDLVALN